MGYYFDKMILVNFTLGQAITLSLVGFFGFFELITNLFYLTTNKLELARTQHKAEIKEDTTKEQLNIKIFQMFILGILLSIIFIVSLLTIPELLIIGASLIFISGLIDFFNFKKTGLLLVWTLIAILLVLAVILL